MRTVHRFTALGVLFLAAASVDVPPLGAQTPPPPPVAKIKPRIDTLHGDTRVDNYFWLREKTNPEVISYLEQENAYTAARMKHTEALQQKLYDEMLGRIKETDLSVPYRKDGYFYYTRTEKGKSYQTRLRRKGSLTAPEELLLDEDAIAAGKKFSAVGDWDVNPAGSHFVYLHDTTALRLYTLYVKDLRTGKLLGDSIARVVPSVAFANDTILYYQTADSARRSNAVWRHIIGTPQSRDVKVFQEDDVLNNVNVFRSKSGKYMMITADGFTSSEWRVVPTSNPAAAPIVVAPRREDVEYQVDHIDGFFLMVTNDSARNFKVAAMPERMIGRGQWADWIPHTDSVFIETLESFRNSVVIAQRSGGLRRLRVMDLATRQSHYITFPEPAYAVSPTGNAEFASDTLRFVYHSMVTPPSTYDYDMKTRQRVLLKRLEVPGFDTSKYEVRRFMVTARDGARVPVSMLVLRNSWKQDGTRPLLLYAYGSYGSTTEAGFNSGVLSLVDRGFAYTIAHTRGGQEMGRQWYDEGKMLKKMNTFNDFIDVAQYLVDNKFTSREKLVAQGGSAGGLLMGAVANMRPDLFRAIVADVAFVDVINTMLDASIPLTAQEWKQWGDPRNKEHYTYMMAYSPYDNVAPKAYPWTLATTSLNDSQVAYWEPAKWVAKLRALKTDSNPLLIKINMAGGHGGSSGRYDVLRERAFRYAFVLDAVGAFSAAPAQQPTPKDSAQPPIRLRVFLDCNDCDFDFMRTEISFVDYVRDRHDANVHILVTDQRTGGGGTEYTLHFIGQRELVNVDDTLRYVTPPGTSPDDLRQGLARIIRLSLVRYYAHLGQSSRFEVTYTAPTGAGPAARGAARDRWNLWVFRTSASGFARGEQSSNFVSMNGSVSANRTTEMWKASFRVNGNYGQSRFTLSDDSRFNSYSHSYSFSDLLVKSLGPHWSAGQRASWTSSTFLNQRRAIRFAPAVEFNVFPYSQSTRKMFTLQYSPGINFFQYQDTTIFDKIREVRGDHTLTASLDLRQPWGSVSTSLEGAAYLNDFSKRHLVFFNSLDLRLFKGFSFFSFGQLSLIRDQLYLPRGDLSDQERLLRRRQLATSYTYFVNLGFSYSFGSIFNNIVNPRFGGTSGGFTIIN